MSKKSSARNALIEARVIAEQEWAYARWMERFTYRQMRDSAVGRDMMIGVDRLDYSKGLEERFLGYERFLDHHPEERKEVFLLQIAPLLQRPADRPRARRLRGWCVPWFRWWSASGCFPAGQSPGGWCGPPPPVRG